jgi:hypothetical protein
MGKGIDIDLIKVKSAKRKKYLSYAAATKP